MKAMQNEAWRISHTCKKVQVDLEKTLNVISVQVDYCQICYDRDFSTRNHAQYLASALKSVHNSQPATHETMILIDPTVTQNRTGRNTNDLTSQLQPRMQSSTARMCSLVTSCQFLQRPWRFGAGCDSSRPCYSMHCFGRHCLLH